METIFDTIIGFLLLAIALLLIIGVILAARRQVV